MQDIEELDWEEGLDCDTWPEPETQDKPRRGRAASSDAASVLAPPPRSIKREAAGFALALLTRLDRWKADRFKRAFEGLDFAQIGLSMQDDIEELDAGEFRQRLMSHARRHWKAWVKSGSPLLSRNVERLSDMAGLSREDCLVLRLAFLQHGSSALQQIMGEACKESLSHLRHMLERIDGSVMEIRAALHPDESRLAKLGLVEFDLDGFADSPLGLSGSLHRHLRDEDFNPAVAVRGIVRESLPAALRREDFAHLERDTRILLPWLRDCIDHQRIGCNALIHGEPGVGKTEYTRWLAQELGAMLLEVPQENDDGEAIDGEARFERLAVCQRLAARRHPALVLFDEIEDAFERNPFRRKGRSKAWANEQLENNPAPTIWLCNRTGDIDPAHLRRFDLIIEMRTPPRSQRRRIAGEAFAGTPLPPASLEAIAAHQNLEPAHVSRIAGVIAALPEQSPKERAKLVQHLATGRLEVRGLSWEGGRDAVPAHYRPDVINANADLVGLLGQLNANPSARICLDGPPGTGKTAFAKHLAQHLDLPLLIRRASDLMSKWVGDNEKLLAQAFSEARSEGAVLLIDEADTFLGQREMAQHNWEVSQVNEFLVQMESFEGLFIATTNRMASLDRAALRRFDHKLHFGYLRPEQRLALLNDLARDLGAGASTIEARSALERLDRLTPGDFAVVRRQFRNRPGAVTVDEIIAGLRREMAFKDSSEARPIGFLQ